MEAGPAYVPAPVEVAVMPTMPLEAPYYPAELGVPADFEALRVAENIVLNHIPAPEFRVVDPQRQETMEHELGHTLPAIGFGYDGELTAKPGKNYLGLTSIYGLVSDNHFSVIAAGSMRSTSFGEAKGTGHDAFQIHYLHHQGNGFDLATAKRVAMGYTSLPDPRLLPRTAQILQFIQQTENLPAIPFSLVPMAMERAKIELAWEDAGVADTMYRWLGDYNQETRQELRNFVATQLKTPETYRQIVDIDANKRLIIDVRDGILADAQLFCPKCGGQSGDHKPGCLSVETSAQPNDIESRSAAEPMPDKLTINLTSDQGLIWRYSNPHVSIGGELFIAAD